MIAELGLVGPTLAVIGRLCAPDRMTNQPPSFLGSRIALIASIASRFDFYLFNFSAFSYREKYK